MRKADQLAAEKAAAARTEFREQLRANRRRINEALKSRPSLIERHEAELVKRNASTRALRKVAEAVRAGDSKLSRTSEYEDLFDDDERLKISVDDD